MVDSDLFEKYRREVSQIEDDSAQEQDQCDHHHRNGPSGKAARIPSSLDVDFGLKFACYHWLAI